MCVSSTTFFDYIKKGYIMRIYLNIYRNTIDTAESKAILVEAKTNLENFINYTEPNEIPNIIRELNKISKNIFDLEDTDSITSFFIYLIKNKYKTTTYDRLFIKDLFTMLNTDMKHIDFIKYLFIDNNEKPTYQDIDIKINKNGNNFINLYYKDEIILLLNKVGLKQLIAIFTVIINMLLHNGNYNDKN